MNARYMGVDIESGRPKWEVTLWPNTDEFVVVTVRIDHPGREGQLSGPPEHCHEAEPPEWTALDATVAGGGRLLGEDLLERFAEAYYDTITVELIDVVLARTPTLVLVGELNPYNDDPRYALYDLPVHASGARLRSILGVDRRRYLQDFRRHDLCATAWSDGQAKFNAQGLKEAARGTGDVLVLLGRKVASAFSVPGVRAFEHVPADGDRAAMVLLPHPSGRNTIWRDDQSIRRAREAIQRVAPWATYLGETDPK